MRTGDVRGFVGACVGVRMRARVCGYEGELGREDEREGESARERARESERREREGEGMREGGGRVRGRG